jgi:hypothetical protein
MQKENSLAPVCVSMAVFFHSEMILNDLLYISEEHKSYALFTN